MLFTGLEGEHEGSLVPVILGHADDTPWHLTDEFLRTAHIAHVGAAEEHGNTQALTVAHSDVGTPLTRGLQHGEISGDTVHDKERLLFVTGLGEAREVLDDAIDIRLLHHHTGHTALGESGLQVVDVGHTILRGDGLQFDTLMQGVGVEHLTCLGIQGTRHQHLILFLAGGHGHHHGLGSGSRTVVHRGVADVHARQFGHHTLIFKDIMERAL